MPKPRIPVRLGSAGTRLWRSIADHYELRPDEWRTLEDAAREVDLVERLEKQLRTSDLMVKGSMGQVVSSPLVSELRQHRATLNTLLRSLKLPDDPKAASSDSSGQLAAKNRTAANARWARRGQSA